MTLFRDLLIEKKRRRYYCEVEYLKSTGTQYINTGYTGNSTTRVIIGASSSLDSSNIPLFGARDTNGYYNSFSIWQNTGANGMRFDYTDTTANVVYSHSWLTTGVNIIEKNGRYNYVNGVQVTSNNEKTFSCNNPFYLMAINTSGIAVSGFIGSVGFCKIYENNTLVRDLIPVLDWSYVPCMYDKVSGKLFYNQGTGSFTYGREIHYVDYLESTGTQYINTGMLSTAQSKVDIEFGFTTMEAGSANNCAIFGGRSDTTFTRNTFTLFKLASTTPQYFRFDYNAQQNVGSSNSLTWDTTSKYRFTYNGSIAETTNITTGQTDGVTMIPASSFTTSPIALFAVNTLGAFGQKMLGRIYKYWYTDGTNTIDMYPAIDENGVGFMFDKVSHSCFLNQGTGEFGYPAREVEYLTSNGSPYIDTEIQPTDDYGYKIRNTYTRGGGEQCAIGCMDNGNRFVGIYTSGAENQLSGAWGSFVNFLPSYAWATGDILDVEVNYKNSRKMIVGGTELKDISDVHISGTISNTLYLFARHYGSTITTMKGNVYSVEITNGQNVVADYIPAFKDGSVGMYDKVSGVLKTNIGTGSFTTGKIVEPKYE